MYTQLGNRSYGLSLSLGTLALYGETERRIAGLDMSNVLVVQLEQHVIYRVMEGTSQGGPR